jgi:sec-independent protein translocase protein TatA
MNLGWTEILLVGGIALLLFGPSKLPNLGRSLGEAIRGFKKGISDDPQQDARDVSSQISQNAEKPLNQETQDQAAKAKDPNKQS